MFVDSAPTEFGEKSRVKHSVNSPSGGKWNTWIRVKHHKQTQIDSIYICYLLSQQKLLQQLQAELQPAVAETFNTHTHTPGRFWLHYFWSSLKALYLHLFNTTHLQHFRDFLFVGFLFVCFLVFSVRPIYRLIIAILILMMIFIRGQSFITCLWKFLHE